MRLLCAAAKEARKCAKCEKVCTPPLRLLLLPPLLPGSSSSFPTHLSPRLDPTDPTDPTVYYRSLCFGLIPPPHVARPLLPSAGKLTRSTLHTPFPASLTHPLVLLHLASYDRAKQETETAPGR